MVHALEEIRRLLKPGGYLIDIHPIRKAPLIKVYRGSDLLFNESDPGYDSDEGLLHTEEVLEEVVQRGLYLIEGTSEFEAVIYASTVAEMREYWAKYGAFDDEPKDEAIVARQNEIYARADDLMRSNDGAEISYHERARITRLKPAENLQS
jgi:SAM-dependent methyltransferase